jgi:hypothetical protein
VRRHNATVVVLAERDYQKLAGKKPDFEQFLFGEGPTLEGVNLDRDLAPPRPVRF